VQTSSKVNGRFDPFAYTQKSHGNFSYVTDETDRQGWIPSSLLEPVCKTVGSGS
jgi:hypothetical protein